MVGDIHIADRPPSVRTEDYADQIFGKLQFIIDYAIENGILIIILAGDVFHVKLPSRTSHALVQRLIQLSEKAMSANIEIMATPGNHDLQNDRLESLRLQPLGVLFQAGVTPLIGDHPDLPLTGVPYLQDWTDLPSWLKRATIKPETLVIAHAPIMPPGRTAPYSYIEAGQWARMQGTGSLYYGHIHELHESYSDTELGLRFCNQGALSRGSLHESDQTREPAFTIYDSDDLDSPFTRVEVPHRPAREVFSLEMVADKMGRQGRAEEFLRQIGETSIGVISIEAMAAEIQEMDAPEPVKTRAIDLIMEQAC